MTDAPQLSIPVILGTPRQGRLSEHVARVMIEQLCKRGDVATTLIDVRKSAGGFGGARVVESLLPVMRELGMVTIVWDVNVSSAGKAFDESGNLLDQALPRRITRCWVNWWMARVLRSGRDSVPMSDATSNNPMLCTACGTPMNQHAQKVDFSSPLTADPVFCGTLQEIHQCAGCGNVQMRPADAA